MPPLLNRLTTISLRKVWMVLLILGLIFLLGQSYVAAPRGWLTLLTDSLLPIVAVGTMLWLLLSRSNRLLLGLAVGYLCLTALTALTSWIERPYGTGFFLIGCYLGVDWYTWRRFGRNLMTELRSPHSTISLGILLSTFVFGLLTEAVNLPFGLWSYAIPLPSLHTFGIPALIAAFGWTPWTMAILAIFYHFVLQSRAGVE